MALAQTPGVIAVFTRDQVRDRWCKSYSQRVPGADTGPNTQPYIDGSVAADAASPLYNDAVTIGRASTLSTSSGPWLDTTGNDEGVERPEPAGASGFLSIVTSAGGSFIEAGTLVRDAQGRNTYQVQQTGLYYTTTDPTKGTPLPVVGVDTGPGTNLAPGTAMQFPSPPPGLSQNATVYADANGNGLTGGRDAGTDAVYRQIISDHRANPPASGNDAEYQSTIRKTPGLQIQQVFTFPAMMGAGTTAYVFTLSPAQPGGSRTPNTTQIAQTLAWVTGQMPGDDGIFAATLIESPISVALRMTWGVGAKNWTDVSPWPSYIAGDQVVVGSSPAPTFTSFRLQTGTTTADPQAGQTLAFWDAVTGQFRRIQIGSVAVVTSGKVWTITPSRSYGASDPSYIPIAGQPVCPWSDSLNSVSPAVVSYFDGLGPGEMVSPLPDPGLRQRRQPPSPLRWPSIVDQRIVIPIYALGNLIETVVPLTPTPLPYATPTGTPGVLAYLTTLGYLALFP